MARLTYRLRMPEPHTHLLGVELTVEDMDGPATLVMPSWTPGSYLMREFPRNVVHFSAADGARAPLPFEKTDKNRWRVAAPGDRTLRAQWVVNADELSVRTSHLDASHAAVNGASVFMYVEGLEAEPLSLIVEAPQQWQVTTALRETAPRTFAAADFEELVDSPLEIGSHVWFDWEVDGIRHRYAIWGRGNYDPQRLADDTTRIIRAEAALFGGLPYPDFTFILHLSNGGRGGLEHRNSTALLVDRWSFRGQPYEQYLALVAHELFHAWNGKRIRPEVHGPFDLTREAYTRDLWVVEGITTYYTDLVLRRAGIISEQRFLDRLGEMISRFQTLPGRAIQSLTDSSFETWIKFYRPDANTPNATISYYQKGALVALLLDLEIRGATGGERSLDDVMRLMWERWGVTDRGYPEGTLEGVAAEVAGIDLAPCFDRWLRGTEELDYARALAFAGLAIAPAHPAAAPATPERMGPEDERRPERVVTEARTGLQLHIQAGRQVVAHVLANTPAWRAGVNAGDEVVALDGMRIESYEALNARLLEKQPGTRVALTVFRRDELLTVPMVVESGPPPKLVIRQMAEKTPEQQQVQADWLRTVVADATVARPLAESP